MSVWLRASSDVSCGCCGTVIRRGEPVRVLTLAQLKRCAACAGEPAPELPALEAPIRATPQPTPKRGRTERFGAMAVVKRFEDWKARQSGEPGGGRG